MFNKVIMVGNLTRDVELRYLPSGSAIGILGLASNRKFKKQDGTQGEEVCFVDVKLFGRTAEIANQYLRKGSKILIEGKLTYETWTDQSGIKRSRHVITAEAMQMLDGRSESQGASQGYESYPPNDHASYGGQYGQMQTQAPYAQQTSQTTHMGHQNTNQHNIPEINIDDDEIPF